MKTGDSSNLNLLPSQAKFQVARMKLRKTLRRYMAIALIGWVAVVIVVAVLYFGSDFILKLQNKKYDGALSSYQNMSSDIILNQLLKYRAKVLGQVLKDRFEYSAAFERINSIFSNRAKVSKFDLDKDKGFMVEVSVSNKESLDYVESQIMEANKGNIEGVEKIIIESATYSFDGTWLVNMEVSLK